MEAKSIDKKTFQVTENGQLIGELTYENFIMLKAEIKLANSEHYEIKPVGFFGTSITVTKNETEIANLKMNWRGQIVFTFQDRQEYIFKAKGLFLNKFTIENKEEDTLIQFDPKFEWSKFNYNYNISYDKKPEDILFVLLGVYASNYLIATMSGATSGIA
jgi:hypothetical protein